MQETQFPAAISQQARDHHLGLPLKKYQGSPTGCLWPAGGLAFLFVGLDMLTGKPIEVTDPAPLTPGAMVLSVIFFLAGILMLVFLAFWPSFHTYYECSDGFLGMRRRKVTVALRWSDVMRITKKKQTVNFIPVSTTYEVTTRQGKEYTIYSLALFDHRHGQVK